MAKIIDGKAIAQQVRGEIREETEKLIAQGIQPGLAVIIVGEDSASQVYVRNKIKACAEVGFYSENYELSADAAEEELLEAKGAIAKLGLQLEKVHHFPIDGADHAVIVLRKVRPTPPQYPRRFNKIKQFPL